MINVSIVIPVYNVEKYLKQCLESVVNQTLDKIEVICINDGSTDTSLDILKEYEQKYNNIVIIDQENKGPGYSRNIGMKKALGKYIYFLDSDDYIELNAMEICFTECERNKLDFITFDSNVFYEEGYSGSDLREIDRSDILDSKICSGKILFNQMMETHGMYYESCLNFFNKDFLNKFQIKYRDNLIYEDVIKAVNSYICANRVKYIDKKLFNRRVRNNSIMTSDKTKDNIIAHHICANELYDLYKIKEKELDNRSKLNFIKCIEEFYMKCIKDSYILDEYDCIKSIKQSIKKNKDIRGIFLDILVNQPILWILVKRN